MFQSHSYRESDSDFHSDRNGDPDSHIYAHCNGNSNSNIYAYGNGNAFSNGDPDSYCVAEGYTYATASADTAATSGQLLFG